MITNQALSAQELWGKQIQYIRYECDMEIPEDLVLQAISIKEGDVLTAESIRHSLKNLNLLNRFSSVYAYSEPVDDGCVVIFQLQANWQIENIRFEGGAISLLFSYGLSGGFSPKTLAREIGLKKGDVYSGNSGDLAIEALKEFYYQNGYAQSEITVSADYNHSLGTVNLVFDINQGEATKISAITLTGTKLQGSWKILVRTNLFKGKQYSEKSIDKARRKLLRFYHKNGYLNVKIFRPEIRYIQETNSVEVNIRIVEGNPIDIEIFTKWHTWNALWWLYLFEGRQDLLIDILGIEGKVNRKELEKGSEVIRETFKNHGYMDARVNLHESTNPEATLIYTFTVDEAEKIEVSDIYTVGNSVLTSEQLLSADIFGTTQGKLYNQSTIDADRNDLIDFYKSRGYKDVSVITGSTSSGKNSVSLIFNIEEGLYYSWADIVITGNSEFTTGEILDTLCIVEGGPCDPDSLESYFDLLIDKYLIKGFSEVSIDWNIIQSHLLTPSLEIEIHEGISSSIDSVLITGYSKTRREVIERNLPELTGKAYYFQTLMNAERQLSKTNLFKSVDISGLEQESGREKRTILISLQEQPSIFLEGGPGYNTDRGFTGYLSFYTTNLGGANRYLGVSSSISQIDNKANIIYREPEFANFPIQLELRVLSEDSSEDKYHLRRRGGRATWSYWLLDQLRLLTVYRFDNDEPYDIEDDAEIPEEYQNSLKIASLTPGFLFDSRDDVRNPSMGSLFSVKVEFARPVYSSEVNFSKITTDATHFFNLPGRGVLGTAFRLGIGYHLPYQ